MLKIIKKKYKNKSFNKKTLNTITFVELNYKNSKKIYKILYGNSNLNNIIKYQ